MKNLNKLQNELSNEINKFKKAPLAQRKFIAKYIGGNQSQLEYLGLKIPQLRSVFKKDLQVLSLDFEQQYQVFEKNWFESKSFEQKALSLFWLDHLTSEQLLKISKKILTWASEVDNWAHSDTLCSVYAQIFELSPEAYLPVYKKWNRHKLPWYRRISMIGLFYYSRQRKKLPAFKLAVQFVTPHFTAKEYYVQKAVGWTIREMYNAYPEDTVRYIKQNLHQISSIAWVAASEKLPAKIKKELLKSRRLDRKNIKKSNK